MARQKKPRPHRARMIAMGPVTIPFSRHNQRVTMSVTLLYCETCKRLTWRREPLRRGRYIRGHCTGVAEPNDYLVAGMGPR